MSRIGKLAIVGVVAVVGAFGVTACGDDDGGGGGGTIIRGTTDQPISYDPAGAYDLPSYDGIYAAYQNLMQFPPGATKPEPEAAESCDFTDNSNTTFECTMRDGLKFSDGSDLTAEDVVFSFERNIGIADPNGASSLLANMKSIEAPDDKTVVFNLKEPDATWPSVIATASFAIVPSDVYPKDKLQKDDFVGSGRYEIAEYEPGQQTVLQANPEYTGEDPPETDQIINQYFDKGSALKLALEQGDVDIAYRSLSPTDFDDLESSEGIEVVSGEGTEIRYMVFNLDLMPGDSDEQKLAIRQAVAQTIDRESIAQNVYNGTVEPLYSMIPQGLDFANDSFLKEMYGESPDVDAAKQTLEDAGVKTPVPLEVWWTPTHYGTSSGDEYAEIKRQLDDSGLFEVTLKSTEWNQYSTAAFTDKYPVYQLGWFPDYPDADDYVGNFYSKTSFLNIHYNNPEMQKQLAAEKASDEDDVRQAAFDKVQEIGAVDVPTIPIWQANQVAGVADGVEGVEETFDPSFIFRYWLLTKSD
jgi:peptide/nickel transport system substrate-binding protein